MIKRIVLSTLLLLSIIVYSTSCKNCQLVYEFNDPYITVETLSNQQMIVRDTIDDCVTFNCNMLEKEKQFLLMLIDVDAGPVATGIQQSIVTSIARRCNGNYDNIPCKKFNSEIQRLKRMLKDYLDRKGINIIY